MKRLTYISRFSRPISDEEINRLAVVSARNNREQGITGVLISAGGLFFQILEGETEKVDRLFEKIRSDERHQDVLCLRVERDVEERLFPEWSMETINLDASTDVLMRPLRILLQNLTESHHLIERYTQPAVLRILRAGIDPLSVPPHKVESIVLFSDLVGFSMLSERLEVEQVAQLVNRFLDIATHVIAGHGGEVKKLLGDGVMATFHPERADEALQACLDILERLAEARSSAPASSPLGLLYCGSGLSLGTVMEGNLGSEIKMNYTIIGDPVNTAARLEALTRETRLAIALSEQVKAAAGATWEFVSLGSHDLKRGEEQVQVYSLDHPLVRDFKTRQEIAGAMRS